MSTSAAEGQRVKGLHGQRVVILGGTSGIGLATAKAAAHCGAEVVADTCRRRVGVPRRQGRRKIIPDGGAAGAGAARGRPVA